MFERPHHQRIAKVLHALNAELLGETQCYFGDGTAIVLLLSEYRQSLDIDAWDKAKMAYGDDAALVERIPALLGYSPDTVRRVNC